MGFITRRKLFFIITACVTLTYIVTVNTNHDDDRKNVAPLYAPEGVIYHAVNIPRRSATIEDVDISSEVLERHNNTIGDGVGKLATTRSVEKGSQSLENERNTISTAIQSVDRVSIVMEKGGPIINGVEVVTSTISTMEERRNRVRKVCASNHTSVKGMTPREPNTKDVLYSGKYGFYYCPVEKVASTFWRRFMYQLGHTNPVKSPFDVSINQALRGMGQFHLSYKQKIGVELEKILASSAKVLFVRDPHSRIFSAFVDKLLAPNPYYWKVWALPSILRYRKDHHKVRGHAHCGHNVTFSEFVSYVLNVASINDGHVKPIHEMCSPCAVSYTIIGKMGTFVEDTKILLDYLHLNSSILSFDSMKRDTINDALADSATDALSGSWLMSSLKCISKDAVLQRIWRKNQIRGFISWRRNIKLTQLEMKSMDSKRFITILTEASRLSTDQRELKLQKMQAMKEAFSQLSEEQLKHIANRYTLDTQFYDYDQYPEWLLEIRQSNFINTDAFDYSKRWDLSMLV